jgi:hypothetical protein
VPLAPQDALSLHLQAPLAHSNPEEADVGHSHPFASLLSQSLQFVLQSYSQFPSKHASNVALAGTWSAQT